eukprot:jgi/Mesvir1/5390/Mv15465-RA.1
MEDLIFSENIPTAVVKEKKVVKPAKAPLGSSSEHNIKSVAANGKTIEEVYQKKSQLEHILLRPDTYVGSVEKITAPLWVRSAAGGLEYRNISYVPGLYKIFDEILVNACDNKQRDASMNMLKVDIDGPGNCIRVWNNGDGVPVEMHAEENVYVPELIFGHLLTSSNYDDTMKKTTGGRNGYGAKLTNIFSKEFVVETADGSRQRKYKQVFRDNMSYKSVPEITKTKAASDNWTCISFKPDLAKFGMTSLEADTVALMQKRVMDAAGCLGKGVKVFLDGQQVPIKSFSEYVELFLKSTDKSATAPEGTVTPPLPRIYERVNDRWEVAISMSDGQFQQVSFVNSINTVKGGTHVAHVTDQVVSKLVAHINKKHKAAGVKPFLVKNHLWVFVNALVENPAFDSQSKETLTTKASAFGSSCELSEEFIKKVLKCGVVESVVSWATFKQSKELKKTDGTKRGRLTGIPKLDDANHAGGRNSKDCTLILTEGDSAKALAVSGLSVVGRDHYGVFPLRGKLLNVREASHKQIMDNAEISAIKQILGLQQGKEYEDTKSLRYGHLMIMTDQDHDGSHIKGLLINFIHSFWPSLLKVPGFLVEFITPIVKATKGAQCLTFYTMPEYEHWKESLGGSSKGWQVKYYKGLGTSTAREAKEYFADLMRHRKEFQWEGEEDGESIQLAFSKKKVDERKKWLSNCKPDTFLDHTAEHISYSEFVNKELILFSMADLARSIPSLVDGLKPGQRKILFACFKRKLKADVKVAQLAGYVSEHAAYHHGEASLMSTIVGLAQDFVGSNNLNLLVPSGQFGTRLQGGKDAASPRYIFTRLSPVTRALFHEADDNLLKYNVEDGQKIEPKWYAPIIPLVLVNGAEGIGTGWSTFVPNYNPRDIVANMKRLLAGEEMEPMTPWYRGFEGTIELSGKGFQVSGTIRQVDACTVEIEELPIRKWTQDYKEFLEEMTAPSEKGGVAPIKDYKEYHTDTKVHFVITMSEEGMKEALEVGLEKKFKITSNFSLNNMTLFNADNLITKYNTPEDIIREFYDMRLPLYEARKADQVAHIEANLVRLNNKARFVLMVVKGELVISNRKKADLLADLAARGFAPLTGPAKAGASKAAASPEETTEEDSEEGEEGAAGPVTAVAAKKGGGYDYLLSMPLWSLTLEKVQELCRERDELEKELVALQATVPSTLWEQDLNALLEGLAALEEEEKAAAKKVVAKKGGRAKPKKKAGSDDDDDYSSDEEFVPTKKAAAKKPVPAKRPATAVPATVATAQVAAALAAPAPAAAKPAVAASKAKATKAAKPATAPVAAPAEDPAVHLLDDDSGGEQLSLMERMSAKLKQRAASAPVPAPVASGAPPVTAPAHAAAASKAAAAKAPARRAAASKAAKAKVVDSDEDSDASATSDASFEMVDSSEEDDSDYGAAPKKAAPKKAAAPKASKKASPPAKAKAPAKAAAPAPRKRLQKAKTAEEVMVVEEDAPSMPGLADTSPVLAQPDKKVRRMRPSPFHKSSGKATGAVPKMKLSAMADLEDSDEEDEDIVVKAAAPAPAPARAARATRAPAKMANYCEISSDDDEEESDAGEDDSEYNDDSD